MKKILILVSLLLGVSMSACTSNTERVIYSDTVVNKYKLDTCEYLGMYWWYTTDFYLELESYGTRKVNNIEYMQHDVGDTYSWVEYVSK